MTYKVTTTIDFSYGHRLLNYEGECRHLHGHNGRVEVDIQTEETDYRGMVVDFSDVKNVVKTWIDDNLDHRMILHRDDPLVAVLSELGEAHYVIDCNPTAENLAAHIHEMTSSEQLQIAEIRLWETTNSYATYHPPSQSEGGSEQAERCERGMHGAGSRGRQS